MTPRLVQGRNQRICLGEADPMGGPNLPPPPDRDRVQVSENLGK